jgi:nitrate/TMAO reductase-like tetraheme cytochrome c subunit
MGALFMKYRYLCLAISLILIMAAPDRAQTAEGDETRTTACVVCHDSDDMKPELRSIPSAWRKSWHYQNDISCHDCHGGDPQDAAMAMSPERGFAGKPQYGQVPDFCGRCHIGILKNYLESGHGKALRSARRGPNCVTCHGSHDIQKADITIIDEKRCSQCHTYERAKAIKQALSVTEKKMKDVEDGLRALKRAGVYTETEDKTLFNTQAAFRTLFHSVDVSLIKARTDEFVKKLEEIEARERDIFHELRFRKNFSAFLMVVFLGMAVVLILLSKTGE